MERNQIVQYFEGKTILVTGATGFLAKVLVEKILRAQPNIKKLHLLIRDSDDRSAAQRFHDEILSSELFRVIREEWGENMTCFISRKVIPISGGDVSKKGLGIKSRELMDEMTSQIDFIINSAATTCFDERYDVAMDINVFGPMNVLGFAKNCTKLKLMLHVSTAFVQGSRAGILYEKAMEMGATLEGAQTSYLDIETEKQLIHNTKTHLQAQPNLTQKQISSALRNLGITRANLHGWPNTYSFTKAMGEMVLGHFKENIPIIIIRPTIISSTFKQPFPGWMEGLRTFDIFSIGYAKGAITVRTGDLDAIIDVVPGDMVVNAMLVAMALHSDKGGNELRVKQVGSSSPNPIKQKEVECYCYRYFKKNPLLDDSGKPINVGKPMTLSLSNFNRLITIQSWFLKMSYLLNLMLYNTLEGFCDGLSRKINRVVRLTELYKPYLFFHGIFDDANTEHLRREMREMEANVEMFDFDPRSIDWGNYFINTHFPGIVKHVLN